MSWPADECVCTGGMTYRDDCSACARISHLEDLIERWSKASKAMRNPDHDTFTVVTELRAAEDALHQEAAKL